MDQFNVPITFYNDFYVGLKKSVPDAELAIMPYPTTPVGRFNPIFVNPIQMTGVVNAEAKDPEAVMTYVDFAASETFMKTMYYGFEGVHSRTLPLMPAGDGLEKMGYGIQLCLWRFWDVNLTNTCWANAILAWRKWTQWTVCSRK